MKIVFITSVTILYLIGIFVSSFYFHKRVLKKNYLLYGYEKDSHNHSRCVFFSFFWGITFICIMVGYFYNLPANIVKNVESRRERFNK